MEKLTGFFAPWIIAALIFMLNALLPGRWLTGYVKKPGTDEKMKYHLNGILVFTVMVAGWLASGYFGIIPYDWLYEVRLYGLTGACIMGLIFTLTVVLPYPPVRKSIFSDLFLGRIENLQLVIGRIDVKMWLYLAGAIMLELMVLSFTAHHLSLYGEMSSAGFILSAVLLTYFVVDYLIYEEVHLYTYDLFAERIGFKLGWGCLVFYPYFYAIPLWATADKPYPPTPVWLLILYVVIFLAGWVLSRGANLQKFYFKTRPGKKFLWIRPEALTDGDRSLLVNGFWGISRHVNYLGEIIMASGIVLCTGYPAILLPWLYPVYYILLLFTRQADDDRRCSLKYGKLWEQYRKRVPHRIIPHVY